MQGATVTSLFIYPVKGCAAVPVEALHFDDDGLIVGDRRAMIVDASDGRFISQRHEPRLARLCASFANDALSLRWPGGGVDVASFEGVSRSVTVWDDTFDAIDLGEASARSLGDWLDRDVRLVALPPRSPRVMDSYWAGDDARSSFADLAPILVTSSASLDDLNARRVSAGRGPVEMLRFRPNIVIEGLPAWAEDDLTTLELDECTLSLIKPCARCNVIELDPRTGEMTEDEVLRSLAAFRASRNRRGTPGVFFGVNAMCRGHGPAVIRVADGNDTRQFNDINHAGQKRKSSSLEPY